MAVQRAVELVTVRPGVEVEVPTGASGSSTTRARERVPAGAPVNDSGGETFAPSQVCRLGIVAPSSNAALAISSSATAS